MKIGIILRKIKRKDGMQQKALGLAHELQRMGHQITVYTFEYDPALASPELTQGLRIVSLPRDHISVQKRFLGILRRPSYLVRWQQRNEHARRLAYLVDRDTELLDAHSHNTYPVSVYFKKEIKDIPCIWEMSSMPLFGWKFKSGKAHDPRFRVPLLKRFFYYCTDMIEIGKFIRHNTIVVYSERNRENVKKFIGRKSIVVQSGIDVERFPYKERKPLRDRKAHLLLTGTLFTYRRFEDAIEAVKLLIDRGYDIRVSVVGAYEHRRNYYEKLKNLAEQLGIGDRIVFLGFVPEEELAKTYQNGDIVVTSAVMQEAGLPFTVSEAMACGTPVVSAKTSGLAGILVHRETALFAEDKSPKDIAASIEAFFDNPELYMKLSRNGRVFVEKHLSQKNYAHVIEGIFQEEYKKYLKA